MKKCRIIWEKDEEYERLKENLASIIAFDEYEDENQKQLKANYSDDNGLNEDNEQACDIHTNLSIEFAISVLEEINLNLQTLSGDEAWWYISRNEAKIQELKEHLK